MGGGCGAGGDVESVARGRRGGVTGAYRQGERTVKEGGGLMSDGEGDQPQVAVWYFVGATFLLTMPMLMFPDLPLWARIGVLVAGLGLIAAGGYRLSEELKERRRDDEPGA